MSFSVNWLRPSRINIQRNPRRLRNVIAAPEFVKFFGKAKPHPKGERQNIFGMEDELKVAPKGVEKDHKWVLPPFMISCGLYSPSYRLQGYRPVKMSFFRCRTSVRSLRNSGRISFSSINLTFWSTDSQIARCLHLILRRSLRMSPELCNPLYIGMFSGPLKFTCFLNRNWTGSLNDMMTIIGAGGGGRDAEDDEDDGEEPEWRLGKKKLSLRQLVALPFCPIPPPLL